MARNFSGRLNGNGLSIGIVVSEFNETITSRLLDGARDALKRNGVREEAISIVTVPGSLELAQVAARMAHSGKWDALITLGCVIRGETAHFEYVSREAARGVSEVALTYGVPIAFGVLTTYDSDQAIARSGGTLGNRGYDAACTAMKMANLYKQIF